MSLEEFRGSIQDVWKGRGSPAVFVQGDTRSEYGVVLQVIAALKASEIDAVGLVAEPEPVRRR